ncbi:hypothetical protein LTR56_015642 [Elasticomyces elasticus]|nr:hypothetical protein LTR22_025215 [Elasticomyces elasticus]KAK3633728.1 hypothetical protein LTR56_015642 [Elasticomyces elasticus]KAK4914527.1 hypothetical protein LTR49_017220 [Elasticomyces elasticus]KAK5754352.1 hypothetical protein LTS12_015530 [Elasticomyces elasticus]
MTTDGPRQAVFATAELLENILMHAPVRSIFVAQSVARQFRDIVATSIDLQQRMFLRPPKPVLAETWILVQKQEHKSKDEVEYREKEYRVIRVADGIDLPAFLALNGLDPFLSSRPLTVLNPLLKEVESSLYARSALANRIDDGGVLLTLHMSEQMYRGVGSWRNTYLTDQPSARVSAAITWSIRARKEPLISGTVYVHPETTGPHGFTLGMLLDAAMRVTTGSYRYGKQHIEYRDSLNVLLDRLEGETGKKANLTGILIEVYDVVTSNEQERSTVQDADDSMIPR